MLRSPLLCSSEVFAKSFKKFEFHNIFGLSNVIDAVIDSWDRKSVCFCDRIYFRVVCIASGFGTRIQEELHSL